jgi:hypothetical protein
MLLEISHAGRLVGPKSGYTPPVMISLQQMQKFFKNVGVTSTFRAPEGSHEGNSMLRTHKC